MRVIGMKADLAEQGASQDSREPFSLRSTAESLHSRAENEGRLSANAEDKESCRWDVSRHQPLADMDPDCHLVLSETVMTPSLLSSSQ